MRRAFSAARHSLALRSTTDLLGLIVALTTLIQAARLFLPDWDQHDSVGQAFSGLHLPPGAFALCWGGAAVLDLAFSPSERALPKRAICLGVMGGGWLFLLLAASGGTPSFLFWPVVLGTVGQTFLVLFRLAGRWARRPVEDDSNDLQ